MLSTLTELIKSEIFFFICKLINFSVFKFFHQSTNTKFLKFVKIRIVVSKPRSPWISSKVQLTFFTISASVFNIAMFIPCF